MKYVVAPLVTLQELFDNPVIKYLAVGILKNKDINKILVHRYSNGNINLPLVRVENSDGAFSALSVHFSSIGINLH